MSENMTYVPSRLTSAKTNKVVAGANEILDDDINLKQDVINTLSKKVIDLNSVPTSSTLTYTVNSVTCDFKVGDEVRVADQESETGYTFYKLYDLTTEEGVTTATWDKLGAGGATPVNPNETVNISLTQVGGNSADLIGASITITDDDSGDTLYTATWAGTMITTEIDVNTNYTVSVSSISGYLDCADKSYVAQYQNERNISFLYKVAGVYIEATDGGLYTISTWSGSGKTANSIVILTTECQMRIGLYNYTAKAMHNNEDDAIESYLTAEGTSASLKNDYNGKIRSDKWVNFNKAYSTYSDSYSAPFCDTFIFPNGSKGAYLPSAGQVNLIYLNMTAINAALTLLLNKTINWQWTNTSVYYGNHPHGGKAVVMFNMSDGSLDAGHLTWGQGVVIPVADYEQKHIQL